MPQGTGGGENQPLVEQQMRIVYGLTDVKCAWDRNKIAPEG